MPAYESGSLPAVEKDAPVKKVGNAGGGRGRPSEGKMFPRGTGK